MAPSCVSMYAARRQGVARNSGSTHTRDGGGSGRRSWGGAAVGAQTGERTRRRQGQKEKKGGYIMRKDSRADAEAPAKNIVKMNKI